MIFTVGIASTPLLLAGFAALAVRMRRRRLPAPLSERDVAGQIRPVSSAGPFTPYRHR